MTIKPPDSSAEAGQKGLPEGLSQAQEPLYADQQEGPRGFRSEHSIARKEHARGGCPPEHHPRCQQPADENFRAT